ncbi:hypothetical protein JCM19992_06670 [Thermostilla marina]
MTDSASIIDRIAARAGELYTLPAVAMEVLDLTERPDVDAAALKRCIEKDPALTAKVLRVVNSSLFGLPRSVADLNQALALLGIKPLKLLVLGFSLPPELFQGVTPTTLEFYWRHTLTKAVAARELCEQFWKRSGDEAFIGGLLQDLGMLVLIRQLGGAYEQFVEKLIDRGDDILAREAQSMGFNHTQLTARLLTQWGLPGTLVEAVSYPADKEQISASARMIAEILELAEAAACFLGDGKPSALSQVVEAAAKAQNIDRDTIEAFLATLDEKVSQLAEVFSVRTDDLPSAQELLARAHQQLAVVAASAATEIVRQDEMPEERLQEEDELAAVMDAYMDDDFRPSPRLVAASSGNAPIAPVTMSAETPAATATVAEPEIDPGLLGNLSAAVLTCRQNHWALCLVLLRYHSPDTMAMQLGLDNLEKLVRVLHLACERLEHPAAVVQPYGDAGCALVLPDCERKQAVEYGHYLVDTIRSLPIGKGGLAQGILTLDVGIAEVDVPSRNFEPRRLLEAAARCLNASHASGGAVVKSIEIY